MATILLEDRGCTVNTHGATYALVTGTNPGIPQDAALYIAATVKGACIVPDDEDEQSSADEQSSTDDPSSDVAEPTPAPTKNGDPPHRARATR